MSRLQRAPEKTTEVREELEKLEDYSPQHPLLAYEPKMNLVRAPDHLQQYVEVNPFEHQFQPAEGVLTIGNSSPAVSGKSYYKIEVYHQIDFSAQFEFKRKAWSEKKKT